MSAAPEAPAARLPFWNGPVLRPSASCAPGVAALQPGRTVDGSGMSGSDGFFQRHDDRLDGMWLTVDRPGDRCWISFDFGRVEPLGAMAVWNFDQGPEALSAPGLRDVRLSSSVDGVAWTELRGPGHPYRFARADGSASIGPTGLESLPGLPIDLGGVAARHLRIEPDPRPGVGNWGTYLEEQVRFGLSEVRFSRYRPPVSAGAPIPYQARSADAFEGLDVLSAGLGLSDPWTGSAGEAVHGADPATMALSCASPRFGILEFEFDGAYPLDRMHVWNYNAPGETAAGLRDVRISFSLDGESWTDLDGGRTFRFARADGRDGCPPTDAVDGDARSPIRFNGARARFVRLVLAGGLHHGGVWGAYNRTEPRYGLSKVVFLAAEGLCAEPRRDWTARFSNHEGWSGADGIFSFPLDGPDTAPDPPDPRMESEPAPDDREGRRSLIVFSDTMIGSVDPATRVRRRNLMVNNTAALLSGTDPARLDLRFLWGTDADGGAASLFRPPAGAAHYYWLQDGVVAAGAFHVFTANIVFDPSLPPEGFQFRSVGVDLLSVPLEDGRPDFARTVSRRTPLFDESRGMHFGTAVLSNTAEAGAPDPDGFLYVYGLVREGPFGNVCVARVEPERIADFEAWRFFDGRAFVDDLRAVRPVIPTGSCECSVTPIRTGPWRGRYAYVGIPIGIGRDVEAWLGDSPTGPFTERLPLYCIPEGDEETRRGANRVYTYNAKAHPHLSDPGALLVSCNMNAMDFGTHFLHADVYRPRFQEVRFL